MIERDIAFKLTAFTKKIPAICLTGPQQSGKTTSSRLIFPDYLRWNTPWQSQKNTSKTSVIQKLNTYFEKSDLPNDVDEDFVNEMLLEVRDAINQTKWKKS